jgi:hypothetical protein
MDAIKFIYEARRRYSMTGKVCSVLFECYTPESIVKELEEWCKEHPFKTRQSEFLKEWPDVAFDGNGVIAVGPCELSKEYRDMCCGHMDCAECRKEFWSQKVE